MGSRHEIMAVIPATLWTVCVALAIIWVGTISRAPAEVVTSPPPASGIAELSERIIMLENRADVYRDRINDLEAEVAATRRCSEREEEGW